MRQFLGFAPDDVNVGLPAAADQIVHQRPAQPFPPARLLGLADHNLRHVARAGVVDQFLGDVLPAKGDRFSAELLGQPQRLHDAVAVGLAQVGLGGRFDIRRDPLGANTCRQPFAGAHKSRRQRAGADADQQPFHCRPQFAHAIFAAEILHLRIDALGGSAQGQLAQGDQVSLAEEIARGPLGHLALVDLPLMNALQQLIGRSVDQLDLIRLFQHRIGQRFAHDDAGDALHHVVEALDVLDVERGVDVDARFEQFHDILPALGMAHARRVGVGQLVNEDQRGMALQGGVEIEFLQPDIFVFDEVVRQQFHAEQEGFGIGPRVRLGIADDDIRPLGRPVAAFFEHGVGFPDAGRGAEEDLQLPALGLALLLLDLGKQGVGIGARILKGPLGHG